MAITFDEAVKRLAKHINSKDLTISVTDVDEILSDLRTTYALTVEMTKNQYWFITSEYEKESVVEAVANLTVDDIIKEKFHSNFWSPLTQEQVVQAWLHPETIKVVE